MFKVGDKLTLEIKNLASTGLGVGFVEKDTNRAIFVPYSVPGDLLEVTITTQKKVYFEAKINKILKPSKNRRKPICKHFTICGACDLLHINYDEQLRQKQIILEFQAKKHGLNLEDLEVIPAKKEYHYRDKVRTQGKGFYKRKSREVVKIEKCHIINDEFNKEVFKEPPKTYVYDYKKKEVTTKKAYYYFEDLEIKHHPNGFVQSNLLMNNELIKKVLENTKGKKVLELYCGNGNFTLPLVKKGFEVIAVEGDRLSHALLLENLERNNLACQTYNLDVNNHTYNQELYDTVILDPPRSGSEDLLNNITSKNVVYVSCNSDQTLKEIKNSAYKIKKTILIDMFPNTKHFETIFILNS
ncbi:MAG: class I SAM-dependent RNA methyltransferase [Candidatus Woesearchaeota archaeon]